jgi:hypothetical protein
MGSSPQVSSTDDVTNSRNILRPPSPSGFRGKLAAVRPARTSRHANMKELRFDAADGVWRVAFAFDTKRKAILLVAGDKSGVSEKKFYKRLIAKADERFDVHLARLKQKERK